MWTLPWAVWIADDGKPTLKPEDGAQLLGGAWDRIERADAEKYGLIGKEGQPVMPRRGRSAVAENEGAADGESTP